MCMQMRSIDDVSVMTLDERKRMSRSDEELLRIEERPHSQISLLA